MNPRARSFEGSVYHTAALHPRRQPAMPQEPTQTMTFRAKPVVKRAHRPAWESPGPTELLPQPRLRPDRPRWRSSSSLIAAGLSWYNDAPRSGRERRRPERSPRTTSSERVPRRALAARRGRAPRIRDSGPRRPADRGPGRGPAAGHRPAAPAARRDHARADHRHAGSRPSSPPRRASTATPEDIDARLAIEATIPESRHAWLIEVKPVIDDPAAVAPTEAQKAARQGQGRGRAQGHPGRQVVGGRRQDRLHRRVDRAAGGRPRLAPGERQPAPTRHSSRPSSRPTVEHADRGRRGRPTAPTASAASTEIAPTTVDAAYQAKIENDGIDLDKLPRRRRRRRHPREAPGQDRRRR